MPEFNLCNDYKKMFENIVDLGTDYLKVYPSIESMVVGISGGIDSALTAAIAREICDRNSKHKLIGVSIPIESNRKSEIENARKVGNAFCDEFVEIKFINVLFTIFKLGVEIFYTNKDHSKTLKEKIRYGNIKARLRMMYLYDKAHRNNGLVLSTDNLTEFYLGFWTLHGDVGDLGFIQESWKTEVYGISNYLLRKYDILMASNISNWEIYGCRLEALRNAINAIPTDGLGVTTSDFDQLGVTSYRQADMILIDFLNGDKTINISHPIVQRFLRTSYKRENPYSLPRQDIIR